ncbi:heat shock 70 kDa protein 12B-like [Ruditapes philippinarum]|uniref:heat shock 70 kDa protein 12B-like n=1 Tax=Ruditapes philippinarum TaxID=129788 RepID=UPI00295B25E6|nr:heat shock 70 kDa protein 12B-like [Ruditapes philippinarum]
MGKDLKRDITINDESGRPLLAADVFGMSIKFLVDDMLNNAGKGIDGGTIDVTVHETGSEHTLREIRPASGGDWGSIMVDKEFENLLIHIVGRTVFEKFKHEEKEDWLDMQREFESRKRETTVDSESIVGMRIPASLIDLYNKHSQRDLCTSLASSQYAGLIELKRDKMKISNKVFVQLFDASVTKTVGHLKSVLSDGSLKDVRILLMVGGYSESPVLQRAVSEALPGTEVLIPAGASSVVLRGALIYGHNLSSISERILKFTHGTAYTPFFIEGIHPRSKRFKEKDGNQKIMLFKIYALERDREDPVYIDDDECFKIGELEIEFDEESNTSKRKVSLSMLFGGTEIMVEVEDICTGKKKITTIDFLG